MPALIAFLADLLKLPPAAVVGIGVGLVVVLLTIREGFRYLRRRNDNWRRYQEHSSQDRLIEKMIERRLELEPAVIQAIRGTAIATAAKTTAPQTEPVDAETDVDGVVRRVVGWMRDLKLPPGG